MTWLSLSLLVVALTGCGVKKYLPAGPATNAKGRAKILSGAPRDVVYTSPAAVPYPVLPLQIFGVTYDLDLVLVSKHPRYNMHEYARVQTPDGDLWLAKDALEATYQQSIIADIDGINAWFPELPLLRKQAEVSVEDQSSDDRLDLTIRYENLEGESVVVHYEGKAPKAYQNKRNGNTMGHSADILMAVLDIPYKNFAKKASVEIDGQDYKISKLLGLVKLQVALKQSQGGLSTASFTQEPGPDDFAFTASYLDRDGGQQSTAWTLEGTELQQTAPLRTLQYTFQEDGTALELLSMDALQFGRDVPVTHIEIRPALPDMRRKFEGSHSSRFVVDINGQENHAYGRLRAWWDGDVAKVEMVPEEPYWTADRPMITTISYEDGVATTKIERIDVDP